MNKRLSTILTILALAVLVPVGGVFLVSSLGATDADNSESSARTPSKTATAHRITENIPIVHTAAAVPLAVASVPHPVYEEDTLDAEMKELFDQIEAAMEGDERAWLIALSAKVHKLIARKGYRAVPAVVRSKMVEALGQAMPYTLPEILEYLADSDPEVAAAAHNAFTDALQDTTNSDQDMAAIIKSIAKSDFGDEVTDAAIDYIESNMRNSVAVDTYINILENGTDEMKAKAKSSIIDFVTARDEDSIALDENLDYDSADVAHLTTAEGLREWAENHPDDEDDADFYKGVQ